MRALILILVLAALPMAPASAVMPQPPTPIYREGEVLVTYRDATVAKRSGATKTALGLTTRRQLRGGQVEQLVLPSYLTTENAIALLRDDPAVARVGPNFLRWPNQTQPDDTHFADQWGLHNTGQPDFHEFGTWPAGVPDADMDLPEAWDSDNDGIFDRTGDGVVTVAIIDDGFDVLHPDLAANFIAGYNFVDGNTDLSPGEFEGHGTTVAGAIGAIGNNAQGVAGAAWNVRLMPLKFGFDVASHIAALEFAAANGADIINASFGGPGFDATEQEAIRTLADLGILYVAAAGNASSNTDLAQLSYPVNLDAPNIVAVAATDRQDRIAHFSQYGALTTDVAAPGVQVVTTTGADGYTAPTDCGLSGSCGASGTSYSAPYTSGVAALLKSHVVPAPGFLEMKARLIEGADPGDDVRLRTAGGRINAANSLNLAPRPSLVIDAIDWIDGNDRLDPGETLSVDITLRNLWQDATTITGTLTADDGVTVDPATVAFADIPNNATATARFGLAVAAGVTGHRYVRFTLQLSADNGYAATREFIAEIGRLEGDVVATATFPGIAADGSDDFHAWHFDLTSLPKGHHTLLFETTATTTAPGRQPDVDVMVRYGAAPQYNIRLGPRGPHLFCTSGTTLNCMDPLTHVSAGPGGEERLGINEPPPGTYHVLIVNYAQVPTTYTLRAYTHPGKITVSLFGGALPGSALAVLALAALARRRVRRA